MIRPLFRSLEKKVKEEVNGDKEAAAYYSGAEENRLEVVLGEKLCELYTTKSNRLSREHYEIMRL